jgi:H(+)-translocating pyrophosphatase
VPVVALALTIFVSMKLLSMFGVALAALGMLSNLCIGLTIDAYGPISDNAGGIAEMCELGANVRKKTDALDAAGNTTAAIGKGFAIGSAALVSLALFGAFVTRARNSQSEHGLNLNSLTILNPLLFSGLLIGSMLPYAFSAMTMKAVGLAASDMVAEIKRQLKDTPEIRTGEKKPNYKRCIEVSTRASLNMMVGPGALVIVTPIVCGFLFGPQIIAGILPGALVSGVQMAISMSNSGGAWDNAKKYIEGDMLVIKEEVRGKNTDEHRAAITGDTVGDPLKDTSGPSINILIKLSAIVSLVFGTFITQYGGIIAGGVTMAATTA